MLQRDRGEDGVHDQRAGSLSVAHKTAQDVPAPFARIGNPHGPAERARKKSPLRLRLWIAGVRTRGDLLQSEEGHSASQAPIDLTDRLGWTSFRLSTDHRWLSNSARPWRKLARAVST